MTVRWVYPPLDKVIMSVGMGEVETYVLCGHNNATQYIITLPILELCMAEERQPEVQVTMRLWEQVDLNLGNGETDTEMEIEKEM